VKGPGKKTYSTFKSASSLLKKVSEEIFAVIDEIFLDYTNSNQLQIMEGIILNLKKCYNTHENNQVNNEINSQLVFVKGLL
jgi:hypothetical protein